MTLQSSAQTVARPTGGDVDRYGRYEILKKLATGGMGEVYLARSMGAAGFCKHVVIKRILPHLVEHGHFVEALVREAKILVMLDHPNIVQVLDLGFEGGDYFMAMEFVHGYNMATVAHYCAQKRLIIPAPACAAIGLSVLAALEYAHALTGPDGERQNIIHRDVSPQNVMISRDGRVKLTDFGIAKVLNAAEGEFTNSLKGKFRYMAPEAVDGGRLDQRYDIFAAGILLFEALCRRHLFGGRSDVDILKQVRAARVPDIERYHPGVDPQLVAVTRKALARDPDARFDSAGAFAGALREAMRPVTESEANAQLRAFVADLYERPDYPINKPKVPNPQNANLDATRSIVLRSDLSEKAEAEPVVAAEKEREGGASRPTFRLAFVLITVVLVLLIGVVAYLVYKLPDQRREAPKVVTVVTRPDAGSNQQAGRDPAAAADASQDQPTAARPDAAGGGRKPSVGSRNPRQPDRRVPKPPISFTPEVGRRYFGRHSRRIKGCLDRFSKPGQQIRLSIVSEILGSGRVAAVRLDPKDQNATPLGQCVARAARRIRYPRHDKSIITYKQPLVVRAAPDQGP